MTTVKHFEICHYIFSTSFHLKILYNVKYIKIIKFKKKHEANFESLIPFNCLGYSRNKW